MDRSDVDVLKRGAAALLALLMAAPPAGAAQALGQVDKLSRGGFEEGRDGGQSLNCLFEGRCSGGVAAAAPVGAGEGREGKAGALAAFGKASEPAGAPRTPPEFPAGTLFGDVSAAGARPGSMPARRSAGRVAAGLSQGADQGALLGFFAVLSPAVSLVSEGFGRKMSRAYDGAHATNANGGAYEAAGIALAVLLYVPALAVAAVTGLGGAVAGAGAELASPGSTDKWDVEKWFDGLGKA